MSDHVTGTDIHYPKSDSLWHDGVDGVLGGADVVVAELELRRVLAVAAAIRTRSAVEGGRGSVQIGSCDTLSFLYEAWAI